jgi:hypothetical protein
VTRRYGGELVPVVVSGTSKHREETMNEDTARTAITVLSRALNQDLVVTVGDRWNEDLEALKILLSDGLAELTVLPARGLTISPTAEGTDLLDAVSEIRREEAAEDPARTNSRIAMAYEEAAALVLRREELAYKRLTQMLNPACEAPAQKIDRRL